MEVLFVVAKTSLGRLVLFSFWNLLPFQDENQTQTVAFQVWKHGWRGACTARLQKK
jgi:hypothetical protein